MTPRRSKADTAANRRLAGLIKEAFEASPMNRAELAEASGVPEGTLAGILAGTKPIYAEQMVGLAEALGAPLGEWVREMNAARRGA
jgi:transcriptional regulator with XRE-family HTH domain